MTNSEKDIYDLMDNLTKEQELQLLENFTPEDTTLSKMQRKRIKTQVLKRINKDTSRKKYILRNSIIAASVAIAAIYFNPYNQNSATVIASAKSEISATVNKIKEFFAPNKTIEQNIEGIPTKSNVELNDNPESYVIYVDKEKYTMEKSDGKDIITPKQKSKDVPEVSMTIEQVLNKKPDAVLAEIQNDLKSKYKTVKNAEKVTVPVNGLLIQASNGNKWNDAVLNCYLIDNTKGGTFIITEKYFFEAEEGHGTRFKNMLKEFKIIDNAQK
jgi:hypothetical protein